MAEGEAEKRFSAEIVSGNEAGPVRHEQPCVIYWRHAEGPGPRDHELDMLVSVHLSDLNDNRSIVNDVELVVYDKLDTMFVNILLNSLFLHVLISNPTSEYY